LTKFKLKIIANHIPLKYIIYLYLFSCRIHAVSVSRSIDYAYNTVQKELERAGLDNLRAEDIVDIMETYQDKGYGESTTEELG